MTDLIQKCKRIKLLLCDVDGVLTDAGMYYSEQGDELKKFSTLDGGGFILLRGVGIRTGLLTGERTDLVNRRAAKLAVDYVRQGVTNKLQGFKDLLCEAGLVSDEVAYIGDDINDVAVLKESGVAASVPGNFLPHDVQLDYTTTRAGGSGAVRELAEWLLQQRGEYEKALAHYFRATSK